MHAFKPEQNNRKEKLARERLAWGLALAGTLPFFGALANSVFHLVPFDNAYFALSYGAIILAFLSGAVWMLALFSGAKSPLLVMITSNLIALLAWGCLLMSFAHLALVLEMVGFTLLYYLDVRFAKLHVIPLWYLKLRGRVSITVMVLLLLMVVL